MKIPKFLRKWSIKKVIWTVIILLIILGGGWYFFGKPKINTSIQTTTATKQNLEQTVLTTGQVVSGTNLDLSFQGSGVVRRVLAVAGDEVSAGQTLASLDQSGAEASLTSAQGSLAQAKAKLAELIA